MSDNKKKVCAILGAGEGLGVSLAKAFAAEGYEIGVITRTEQGSSAALEAAKESGSSHAKFFEGDATKAETIKSALQSMETELGPIYVFIHNVRSTSMSFKEPLEVSVDDLKAGFDMEVIGAHAAAQAVLPGMMERGEGTFILSSATAAFRGSAIRSVYATSKFALRGYAQCLAKAYAKKNIHVVHVRLDCMLGVPVVKKMLGDKYKDENASHPDDVAKTYVWTVKQPKSAWSNEIEIRPYTEDWTY